MPSAALVAEIGPLSGYEEIVAEQPRPVAEPVVDVVEAPPPSLALVLVSPADQTARLAALAQRLDAARPKREHGIRQMDWQAHQTAARAAAGLPGTDWQAWRTQARLAVG